MTYSELFQIDRKSDRRSGAPFGPTSIRVHLNVMVNPERRECPVQPLRRGLQEPVPGLEAGHDRAGPVQDVSGVLADQAVIDALYGESVQGESARGAEPNHAEPTVTAGLARQPRPRRVNLVEGLAPAGPQVTEYPQQAR